MDTPICDFVRRYAESDSLRLHMPGHKGTGPLGIEALDITEIAGADSLYEARGIIAQSEANASSLFSCPTFYATEGSSQCIRAMVYLSLIHAKRHGKAPLIAAARNVHKSFLSAVAMLDVSVDWLYPSRESTYLSCILTPQMLESYFAHCQTLPTALYITSPDYLGNLSDIAALAQVCHRYDVLLLVDNAHGAYLKFLPGAQHPVDQGADLCCDSAHKTLPVLTGGAYLHVKDAFLAGQAKNALALFGSTSPSYLILQSLDAANALLSDPDYRQQLAALSRQADALRRLLRDRGIPSNPGNEPLKITLSPHAYGYTGSDMAGLLRLHGIECEFSDPDILVLMLTPAISQQDLQRLADVLTQLPRRPAIQMTPPPIPRPEKVLSIREALLSPSQTLPVEQCQGRILASASVCCPPAVPIVICGERIDSGAIRCFRYYGIDSLNVIE